MDIDLTFDELPELGDDAIEMEALDLEDLEALDDALLSEMPPISSTTPAPQVGTAGLLRPELEIPEDAPPVAATRMSYAPEPRPEPPRAGLPPLVAPVVWTPPPPAPSPVPLMLFAFGGSLAVTLAVVLIPWFVFVSPGLQTVRARLTAPPAPPVPLVIQVPAPAVAPVAPAVEPVVTPEPAVAVAAVTPAPVKAPAPTARPRRPSPAPTLSVTPAPQPAAATSTRTAEVAPAPAATPEGAANLSGRFQGTAGGDAVTLDLSFKPGGRLIARIERPGVPPMDVVGGYTQTASGASFVLTEPGAEGWVYTGTADGAGALGQVKFPDGKRKKLKVRR